MTIRVAIVEDDRGIREGLSLLVGGSPGFTCTAAYPDAESALEGLPKDPPDVVLMDIHLPGMDGISCVGQASVLCPGTQFMMSTAFDNDEEVFNALRAGANGYVLKNTPPVKLLDAITELHAGGSPMSASIARKVIGSLRPEPSTSSASELSGRELEILEALSKGMRYQEVADSLFISVDTVRSHVRAMYGKLQVHSRTDAVNKVFPRVILRSLPIVDAPKKGTAK
jgi:DNA-binding NarL/FixJ family response regulator